MDTISQAPLILITGGSRGVGAATARLAAAQGYDVAISFVSNETAAPSVAADVEATGRRALPVRADTRIRSRWRSSSRRSTGSSDGSMFW
jgi:NAD(P)-dependent dehydrogenase (short-subunit alcohol dehydrogenase family)